MQTRPFLPSLVALVATSFGFVGKSDKDLVRQELAKDTRLATRYDGDTLKRARTYTRSGHSRQCVRRTKFHGKKLRYVHA